MVCLECSGWKQQWVTLVQFYMAIKSPPGKLWLFRCSIVQKLSTATAKSLQSCPTLCDPIDGSPPGSPIPGILQARILEWVAISFSNAWKWKVKSESEVAQSCPTLSDPMDCSPPGSSVHGIFQARVLEWGSLKASETVGEWGLQLVSYSAVK